MYKGIFWSYLSWFDDDMYGATVLPIRVKCDADGNPLEAVEFSSKSGENFNHKTEWEKMKATSRMCRKHPFDYFPRGRVEVNNGNIKVFANPVIIAEESAKNMVVKAFELEDVVEKIIWIADESKHYSFLVDCMSGDYLDDDED